MSDTVRITETVELDLSGRQLGDYRILRRLGRGGMADVYLAEQTSLRRQVALKVLKREFSSDDTYVRRFHFEAQAAAALVHANIVQIYEVGRVESYHYIAQEYVQGYNLRELMTRRGLPEPKLALSIMRQVTAALARAAEQGVIHRDIKPENIMLTKDGEVKVADFGLARITGNGKSLNLTQVGITMGTPLYMSPEQVEGRSLDTRSDLYSLGVTCYHMLAGEPPFRGETALAVAIQHVRSEPERLESLRADLPAGLCRVVHKMMAKEPQQRFQHPREVLRELRSLQAPTEGEQSEVADEWTAGELAALGETPIAFTQELDGLMKTQTMLAANNRWRKYAAAAAVGALLVGGLIGFASRESFLLADQQASLGIEQETAEAQVQYALFFEGGNNPDAWDAVLTHHADSPDSRDQVWVAHARQTLAMLYLKQNKLDLSLPLFEALAAMPAVESQARARGLAGQVVIYAIQGDPRFADKMTALSQLMKKSKLVNPLGADMSGFIEGIIEETERDLPQEGRDALSVLLEGLNVGNRPNPR
ncbi:MAG: serine/threonine-protein kinase [Pirellulales bacterium]